MESDRQDKWTELWTMERDPERERYNRQCIPDTSELSDDIAFWVFVVLTASTFLMLGAVLFGVL